MLAVTVNEGVSTSKVLEQLVPMSVALLRSADVVAVIVPEPVMPPEVVVRLTVSPPTGPDTTSVGALTAYEVPAELEAV